MSIVAKLPVVALIRKIPSKEIGVVFILTLASQTMSAATFALLPLLSLETSDLYSIAIQIGTGPYNGVVLGVAYLIAVGRPGFSSWSTFPKYVVFFSCLFLALAIYSIRRHHPGINPVVEITVILSYFVGGLFMAFGGLIAARLACAGAPAFLAATAVAPNTASFLGAGIVNLVHSDQQFTQCYPAVLWAFGAAGNYLFIRRHLAIYYKDPVTDIYGKDTDQPFNDRIQLVALLFGVVASTVLPTFYTLAMTKLAIGTATIMFAISKVGGALIGMAVNSFLTVIYNWNSPINRSHYFPALCSWGSFVAFAIGAVMHWLDASNLVSYSFVLMGWIFSLIGAPVLLREVNVRRIGPAILIKVLSDVSISLLGTWILLRQPTITGYLSIISISQCVTIIVSGFVLRAGFAIGGAAGAFVVGTFLLVEGW